MFRIRSMAVLIAIAMAVVPATVALAHEAPTTPAAHPFVGAWLVDTNTADSSEPHTALVVHSDGTLIQADQANVAIGAGQATGAKTAAITMTALVEAGDGQVNTVIVRANVSVDATGGRWSGEASVENI